MGIILEPLKPIIYGQSLFDKGPYEVYVGAKTPEDLPTYIVYNKHTGVVEFSNEVLYLACDWVNHFVPKLAEIMLKEERVQNVIPFPKVN